MAYATYSNNIRARTRTIWDMLVEKAENPVKYVPEAEGCEILQRFEDGFLRVVRFEGMAIKERVIIDRITRRVTYVLLEHPAYTGQVVNEIVSARPDDDNLLDNTLIFTVEYQKRFDAPLTDDSQLQRVVEEGVERIKRMAEKIAAARGHLEEEDLLATDEEDDSGEESRA